MNKIFNIKNLVRSNVQKLKPYSSARDEYKANGTDMVFLDANENPFKNGVNRYPDPQQRDLKLALAKLKNLKPEQVLLGNGSDEVLDLIFRAFCEPQIDNILTLPPTYGMYNVLAGINNVENKEVLLTVDYELDIKSILNAVTETTKLIFICNPNNPTGNAFDARSIKTLIENFNGIVVIDEAYIDFSSYESWINFLDIYPNIIIIQTLSKAYGMAGVRLGVCYASAEIITVLNKIKPPYNVNELTQQKALERVLKVDEVFTEVETIIIEREKLIENLQEVSFIETIFETETNFILVKLDNATKRYHQLLEKGIVIRNRTNQPLCENTLRFTVGTEQENEKLIKALQALDN